MLLNSPFFFIARLHFYILSGFIFLARVARPCAYFFFHWHFCLCSWLQLFFNKLGEFWKALLPLWLCFSPSVTIVAVWIRELSSFTFHSWPTLLFTQAIYQTLCFIMDGPWPSCPISTKFNVFSISDKWCIRHRQSIKGIHQPLCCLLCAC